MPHAGLEHGPGMARERLAPERMASWAPLPLRLIVGAGFVEHGWAKLERGVGVFGAILHAIGLPHPDLLAWATVAVELGGGLAVLAGAAVTLASLPMAFVLVVAIVTVHWPNGFSSIKLLGYGPGGARFGAPGYECDLLYLAGLAALVLGGAGPFSADGVLARGRLGRGRLARGFLAHGTGAHGTATQPGGHTAHPPEPAERPER